MSAVVGVVGAGSWGTTLANLLAKQGHPVRLWALEPEVAAAINTQHQNTRYLEGIDLDPRLTATNDLSEAVADAEFIVTVSPAQYVHQVMSRAADVVQPDTRVVSASKGIEKSSLRTMAEVLRDVLPEPTGSRVAFLSGPSFAREVAQEQPTAVTVASKDAEALMRIQGLFQTPYFRVYTTDDVVGVELGGALKNVIAIAAGMVSGLGLGHNAIAALITRGLAEIARLADGLGADRLTLSGLAGMGDLILTCTGDLSRNRFVGRELGRGRTLDEILANMDMVAEGVDTTRAALALARREGIEMPIVEEVHAVLFEGRTALEALDNLMTREPKPEVWG